MSSKREDGTKQPEIDNFKMFQEFTTDPKVKKVF